MIWRDSKWW